MPQSTPSGLSANEQGIAGVLDIIEARLQAIEQAVFGGAYSNQAATLGSVNRSNRPISGPGNSSAGSVTGSRA